MAKRYNLVFEQSATFKHTVSWVDSAGAAVNLTGYRIRLQVRATPTATAKLLDFDSASLASGMSITALGASGTFTITLTPAVTGSLTFSTAEYDLTATAGDGTVYRLHEGKASVSLGVTR